MEFKKLEFSDLELIKKYYTKYTNRTCDRTIGGTFMWRDFFQTSYAMVSDTLILKCKKGKEEVFCFPLGENLEDALLKIRDFCRNLGIIPKFAALSHKEKEYLLKSYPDAETFMDRDWSDYLYLAKDHANFSGRKFTTQRNHVNKFLKKYEDWELRLIEGEVLSQVTAFYRDYETRFAKNDATAIEEQKKTEEVLKRYTEYGFEGYALYVNKKVVGFALGEVLGDTLYVHVEKADKSMEGVNAMLVTEFAKAFENRVTYINREEDVGDMGLRYSKTKYRPIDMVYKYEVSLGKIQVLNHPEESRSLYEECFDDTREFVDYYYENLVSKNRVLAVKYEEKVISMVHMAEKVFEKQKQADYYYAIATGREYRHKGYMEQLMGQALKLSKQEGKGLVYLIPAVKGLYERFGFAPFGYKYLPLTLKRREEQYEKTIYQEYGSELVKRLREVFIKKADSCFDDWIVRDEAYYEMLLKGLFAEKGQVVILSQNGRDEGYVLESKGGVWEVFLDGLMMKKYALGRIVNVERVTFNESILKDGYYKIADKILEENQGIYKAEGGRLMRMEQKEEELEDILKKEEKKLYRQDISELIFSIKYEKVYISDEI